MPPPERLQVLSDELRLDSQEAVRVSAAYDDLLLSMDERLACALPPVTPPTGTERAPRVHM